MADAVTVSPAVAAREGRWRSLADVYRAVAGASIANFLQYRVNLVIDSLIMTVEPVIYLVVWRLVAEEAGGEVDGFTAGRFAAYYTAWGLVATSTMAGSPYNWQFWIRTGRMSGMLVKPIHPIHQDVATWLGFAVIKATSWIPAGVVLTIVFQPDFDLSPTQVVVFFPALVMALLLKTLIWDAVGLSAFWLTRIDALSNIVTPLNIALSGRLVPPELMPHWAQVAATILPFRWMFAFPVEVLIGPISGAEMALGLAVQAAWLLGVVAIISLVWRRAVRRYAAVAG